MSDPSSSDSRFMRAALAIGRRGLGNTWPNPAVGCVIARDDGDGPYVIGRGWTKPGGSPHAETEALRQAGARAGGSTVYVTLEPCSHHGKTAPCAKALIEAGVARVVVATSDPDPLVAGQGLEMLRQAGIAVVEGVCEAQAKQAHIGHIIRVTQRRPAVILKMALSADGKAAGPGGAPARITSEEATQRVHLMRSMADAIAIGAGTARHDDPMLTVRLPGLTWQNPVRVVIGGDHAINTASKLVETAHGIPLWLLIPEDADPALEEALGQHQVEVIRVSKGKAVLAIDLQLVDLAAALRALAARGITRLLCEGGPTLAAALIEEDLVDEAILFHSPDPLGEGVEGFTQRVFDKLEAQLPFVDNQRIGRDVMITYRRI